MPKDDYEITKVRQSRDALYEELVRATAQRDRYRAALEELAAYCGDSSKWGRAVEARAMLEVMIDNALEGTR